MFLKECDIAMPDSLLCSVNFEFITEERLSIFFHYYSIPLLWNYHRERSRPDVICFHCHPTQSDISHEIPRAIVIPWLALVSSEPKCRICFIFPGNMQWKQTDKQNNNYKKKKKIDWRATQVLAVATNLLVMSQGPFALLWLELGCVLKYLATPE